MPELGIKLDGDGAWPDLGAKAQAGKLVQVPDDANFEMAGLADGMRSGKPSIAFRLDLPDGTTIVTQTSWRLFAMAFWAFAAKFGERPDMEGTAVEADLTGSGHKSRLEIVSDDPKSRKFVGCEICGEQRDADSFARTASLDQEDFEQLPPHEQQFYEVQPGPHGAKDGQVRYQLSDIGQQRAMLQWLYRHFREKHPDWTPPVQEPS